MGGRGASSGGEGTGRQIDSLTTYQNYGYNKVNESLRSGIELDAKGKQIVKDIDKIIEEQKPKDLFVFRGDGSVLSSELFSPAGIDLDENIESLYKRVEGGKGLRIDSVNAMLNKRLKGAVVEDKAFLSTSTSQEMVMEKFVPGSYKITRHGASGLVRISGKAKSVDVDSITGMGSGENERLLGRSTRLKIDNVQVLPHPDGKRLYLLWDAHIQ